MDTIKPSVMQDFRNELGVASSPSFFDGKTPLTPVSVVAGNIGFVKPRSSQKLLAYSGTAAAGADYNVQITAVTTTKNVYFVGLTWASGGISAGLNFAGFDAASGTGYPSIPHTIGIFNTNPTPNAAGQFYPPFPIPCKAGIRLFMNNPGASGTTFNLHYIEEDPVN